MVRKIKEKNDWDPWIKLQKSEDFWNYSNFSNFIEEYPKHMQKAAVLAMTIAKWHSRNSNRGYGHCAACIWCCGRNCTSCYAHKVCGFDGSLYAQFCQARSKENKNKIADSIYKILRSDYDKEVERIEKRERGK